MTDKSIALIVAAGKGIRYGGTTPKQYELLNGKAILAHSVEAFLQHPQIDSVRVVINPEHEEIFKELEIDAEYCFGGDERQDSVRLGLEGLECENVLIHDAARPNVSRETIDNVLEGLQNHDAVIPVIDAKDSARLGGESINRDELKFVQTPQGFKHGAIIAAHKACKIPCTDDAQVAEAAGMQIYMVKGDDMNYKVTTPSDVAPKAAIPRVGFGFDVHGFEDGDHVMLCGVKVPHNKGLKGHSDADVGLHAITDAILGAIGEGDIGEHFSPHDDRWLNAESSVFLMHAASFMARKNGVVNNIDVTIICEAPKLSTHKDKMRARVADILSLDIEQVNIKATTTEKLGFTGRGEGIAAQAVASISIIG